MSESNAPINLLSLPLGVEMPALPSLKETAQEIVDEDTRKITEFLQHEKALPEIPAGMAPRLVQQNGGEVVTVLFQIADLVRAQEAHLRRDGVMNWREDQEQAP